MATENTFPLVKIPHSNRIDNYIDVKKNANLILTTAAPGVGEGIHFGNRGHRASHVGRKSGIIVMTKWRRENQNGISFEVEPELGHKTQNSNRVRFFILDRGRTKLTGQVQFVFHLPGFVFGLKKRGDTSPSAKETK